MRGINRMLQQAQQLQKKMEDIQNQLDSVDIEGSSGGGMVKVMVTGKGDFKKIKIDPTLLDPAEVDMLVDLIVAAAHDAKTKADGYSANEMSKVTGGMALPAGMKFPF